jgi:hypothetical protein
MWESLKNGKKFNTDSIFNDNYLILTLFQEVEVVTLCMLFLLFEIFKGTSYISSGVNTNILDQYKDDIKLNCMTVINNGTLPESFRGRVVYGKRIGEPVNFSSIYSSRETLPGIVMKKLIVKELVIPIIYC